MPADYIKLITDLEYNLELNVIILDSVIILVIAWNHITNTTISYVYLYSGVRIRQDDEHDNFNFMDWPRRKSR